MSVSDIDEVTITDDGGRASGNALRTDPSDTPFGPADAGPMIIEIAPDEGLPASGRLICVRRCDGYFFPLDAAAASGDSGALCQALCPGAETSAFSVPNGPVDLGRAISLSGQSYTSLPGAFRYQTRQSPSCGCKGEAQTWLPLLGRAEGLIRREPGDIVVTEGSSAALSRPARRAAPATRGGDATRSRRSLRSALE